MSLVTLKLPLGLFYVISFILSLFVCLFLHTREFALSISQFSEDVLLLYTIFYSEILCKIKKVKSMRLGALRN